MRVIKGLIIKDLMNIKSYKTTMFFLILIFAISSFINNDIATSFPMMISIVFGMIAISSFSYDNFSKADKYILSFCTKKEIVQARYIYILLFTIIGSIIGLALSIILQLLKVGNLVDIENILLTTGTAVLTMIILQIIQIPIMYKFGAEKGRIIQMVSIIIVITAISGIIAFSIKMSPYSLDDFFNMFMQYGYIITAFIIAILYVVSYKISYKIYLKKEI